MKRERIRDKVKLYREIKINMRSRWFSGLNLGSKHALRTLISTDPKDKNLKKYEYSEANNNKDSESNKSS